MIKVKGLFRSFPVDLCSEEFGSVHMMGRGDLLCDIYHVEIPRVSLEALRALEGLAPPVSFITGFSPPTPPPWLLVVGWGLGFTCCQSIRSSPELEPEQESFSSTALNVKACPSQSSESAVSAPAALPAGR